MNKKRILVDFDGVIHSYVSGWTNTKEAIDPPVEGAINWLEYITQQDDLEICIYSSRSSQEGGIECMKKYLIENGLSNIAFNKLIFPTKKGPAFLTIDDRVYLFKGDFPSYDYINNFKSWNK